MDLVKVGKNIQNLRNERGYTQRVLAEKADISTVHISHIETGIAKMSLECLIAIADALHTTPDYLLFGTYTITDERAAQQVAERMKGLTKDEIAYVFDTIDLLHNKKINR